MADYDTNSDQYISQRPLIPTVSAKNNVDITTAKYLNDAALFNTLNDRIDGVYIFSTSETTYVSFGTVASASNYSLSIPEGTDKTIPFGRNYVGSVSVFGTEASFTALTING